MSECQKCLSTNIDNVLAENLKLKVGCIWMILYHYVTGSFSITLSPSQTQLSHYPSLRNLSLSLLFPFFVILNIVRLRTLNFLLLKFIPS